MAEPMSDALLLAKQNKINEFWPHTGICWGCHGSILSDPRAREDAKNGVMITGCPFCHKSFVD